MFGKVIYMEMKRAFHPLKTILVLAAVSVLMFSSCWHEMGPYFTGIPQEEWKFVGAVDFLDFFMKMDSFRVVIVLLLCSLHATSFCKDDKSRYLRLIMSRVDFFTYTMARFLSNILVIVLVSTAACYLVMAAIMALGFPIVSENAEGGLLNASFYQTVIKQYPQLYIGMMGLQLGMVAAMFSSIGLLFSAWQPDSFICIGVSGLVYYVLSSAGILRGTPLDILNLVGMQSTLPSGSEAAEGLMFVWGMLYPLIVITLCCIQFLRRMKWRVENGLI